MYPSVTVISAFHNMAGRVAGSLGSLAAQRGADFRAVIVDDGSTDTTWAEMAPFGSGAIEVRRQSNAGFTVTVAALAAAADTEFIAIHGAGDESLPDRLARQAAFLRDHPSVVAVGCGIENVDHLTGRRWTVMPPEPLKHGPILAGFGISHGEVMMRRSAYVEAGGYRAAFEVGQATDLFRRMSRLGDFGYVQDVLYRRALFPTGINARLDKLSKRELLDVISDAAHRAAIEREAGAPVPPLRDDFDVFGAAYPWLIRDDPALARVFRRAATMMWLDGQRDAALHLARMSLKTRLSLRGLATWPAIALGRGRLERSIKRWVVSSLDRDDEHSLKRMYREP